MSFASEWEFVTDAVDDRGRPFHVWRAAHREGYTAWQITHKPAPETGVESVPPSGHAHYTSFNGLLARSCIITDYRPSEYVNHCHPTAMDMTLESALALAASVAGRRTSIPYGEEVLRAESIKLGDPNRPAYIAAYQLLKFATNGHRW